MTTKFDNLSLPQIADEYGILDGEIKALEKRMKEIRESFLARGVDAACGEKYTVTKIEAVRWTLDQAAAKEALGEAWVQKHSKITPVTSVRIAVNR